MTKLSENIIGKITCERIAPIPRWRFLFKDGFFWTIFIAAVILGSLSFSVIMHIANSGDMNMLDHLQGSMLTSAVMLLPYFWILFLMLFVAVAYLNWKCTKKGYRYKRRWIISGSIVLSFFFGGIFYALGMAINLDRLMTVSIPLYNQSKHDALNELWSQPEKGLLAGKIIDINEVDEILTIKDESGKVWTVADEGVGWENDDLEEKGKIIKVVGSKSGENHFEAKEIRRCNNCQDDEGIESAENEKEERNRKVDTEHRNIILEDKDEEKEDNDSGDDERKEVSSAEERD